MLIQLVYHIHVMPVTDDGNCTTTLGHLDPFIRGETPACTMDRPDTCQVGDLAGKHGKMNGTSFKASYTDPFVSLQEGMGSFFGNRSFVIHFANTTRIACGNFSSLSNVAASAAAPGFAPTATLVPAGGPSGGLGSSPSGGAGGALGSSPSGSPFPNGPFLNGSAAVSSAEADSNGGSAVTSAVAAATSGASQSLSTSTTFVAGPAQASGASATAGGAPAQETTNAASGLILSNSLALLGSFAAGLWCLV